MFHEDIACLIEEIEAFHQVEAVCRTESIAVDVVVIKLLRKATRSNERDKANYRL
jgi:hypothetical protein